jgi:hypothetical protein
MLRHNVYLIILMSENVMVATSYSVHQSVFYVEQRHEDTYVAVRKGILAFCLSTEERLC